MNDAPTKLTLRAVHNPTETVPSFVLPMFSLPAGSNELYVQILAPDLTVFEFSLADFPTTTHVSERELIGVGDPALFAFQTPANLLIGHKEALKSKLIPILEDIEYRRTPVLRFEIIDFCDLKDLITSAAQDAYQFLRTVSNSSANYWRDWSLLTSRARRIVRRLAYDNLPRSRFINTDWEAFALALRKTRPVLRMNSEFTKALKPIPWWESRLRSELAIYLSAFGASSEDLTIELTAPPIPQTTELWREVAASTASKIVSLSIDELTLERFGELKWIILSVGNRSSVAGRHVARASRAVYAMDLSRDSGIEMSGTIDNLQELLASSLASSSKFPRLMVLFDVTRDDLDRAGIIANYLREEFDVHGVGLYRTQKGIPHVNLEGWISETRTPHLIIVPDNEVSLSDADRATPIGAVIQSLTDSLDTLKRDKLAVAAGLSMFSSGWTRSGARYYRQALTRAILGGANPWLPAYTASAAEVIIASVGRLPIEPHELEDTYGDEIGRVEQRIPVSLSWRQRRFISGANVATTVSILSQQVSQVVNPPEIEILATARLVISLMGFSIQEERDRLLISSEYGEPLSIVSSMNRFEFSTAPGNVNVILVRDRTEQKDSLKGEGWRRSLPLMFSDLCFLRGARDLHWGAYVLACLAHLKGSWRNILHEIVEGMVRDELTKSPQLYAIHSSLNEMLGNFTIGDVGIEIVTTTRLPGRSARLFGSLELRADFGENRPEGALSQRYSGKFIAEINPRGFKLTNATLLN